MPVFRAYAKINLGLLILEKRPDGFHSIETVFHRVDIADEISIEPSDAIEAISSSPDAPGGDSNICYKAVRILQEHFRTNRGARITITKNIPVGAGLGGGSSDAATVLQSLPRLWNRSLDAETLRSLALTLGSDVPYFLGRSSALGRGRGEQLDFFELDIPYLILLCNPKIHVSTAWAYRNIRPSNVRRDKDLRSVLRDGMTKPLLLASGLRNDFEPVVFGEFPEVLRVKEAMLRGGAVFSSLSGSGSTVFGFFQRGDSAVEVEQLLRAKGHLTFLTRPHFQPTL